MKSAFGRFFRFRSPCASFRFEQAWAVSFVERRACSDDHREACPVSSESCRSTTPCASSGVDRPANRAGTLSAEAGDVIVSTWLDIVRQLLQGDFGQSRSRAVHLALVCAMLLALDRCAGIGPPGQLLTIGYPDIVAIDCARRADFRRHDPASRRGLQVVTDDRPVPLKNSSLALAVFTGKLFDAVLPFSNLALAMMFMSLCQARVK